MDSQDITADQWLAENPYILEERYGHVYKTEIFRALGISAAKFRIELRAMCDSDVDFAKKYEQHRTAWMLPIAFAECIIRKIVNNPNCRVQFNRATG